MGKNSLFNNGDEIAGSLHIKMKLVTLVYTYAKMSSQKDHRKTVKNLRRKNKKE